jgi:hypothetical protein
LKRTPLETAMKCLIHDHPPIVFIQKYRKKMVSIHCYNINFNLIYYNRENPPWQLRLAGRRVEQKWMRN